MTSGDTHPLPVFRVLHRQISLRDRWVSVAPRRSTAPLTSNLILRGEDDLENGN